MPSLRLLDLSRLLPGPYASRLLADHGFEVIKIETPLLGDYARQAPPEFGGDAMFHLLNHGKRSLALNYRNREGRAIFLKLAETADVILETFKPGSMDKWGLGYQAVKALNPGIIYCSLSGYGATGPLRDRVGHDLNYIALGGLLGLTGAPDGPPIPPAAQIADLAGASHAVIAILAALLQRAQTGAGQFLDIAMHDAVVQWMLPTAGAIAISGRQPQRGRMPLTGGSPCNNVYETADGRHLTLAALEPPFWNDFCAAVARPDLTPRAFDETAIPEVADIFRQRALADWIETFRHQDVPLEPVLTLAEVPQHPQVKARGSWGGALAEGGAPPLGRDTRAILREAGYSPQEIQAWAEKKIIGLGND
jgi:crotonobetainyl-CoA:carnitine CoA-transferase CaiB-like acyl-CoA transferase